MELPAEMQLCQEMRLSDFCSVGTLGHLCIGRLLVVSYTAGKKSMEKPTTSILGAVFSCTITKVLTLK